MSDAIEVLKDLKRQYSDYCNEYQLEDDNKFIDALGEALLALEQVEKIKAYLKYRMHTSNRTADREMAYVVEYETLEELVKQCKIELEEGVEK